MEPPRGPQPPNEGPAEETIIPSGQARQPPAETRSLAERLEDGLAASDRWLDLLQDAILVGVAVLMVVMGAIVLVSGFSDLIGTLTVEARDGGFFAVGVESGRAVVEVAENALLALILAELVGTLLLSIRGRSLTIEPFIAIATIAVVRHLLFATVGPTGDHLTHTIELLGMGVLILLLVAAVVLLRRGPQGKS